MRKMNKFSGTIPIRGALVRRPAAPPRPAEPADQDDFALRLQRHLRSIYPALTRDDAALRNLVDRAIAEGPGYDLVTEADIARLAEYMVYFHPGFARDPAYAWAAAILNDSSLGGTEKMDRIDKKTQDRG